MRRRTLFGQFAQRQYRGKSSVLSSEHRSHLEPLEERRLLTASDLLVATLESPASADFTVSRLQVQPTPTAGSVAVGDHGLGRAQGLAQAPDGSFYVSSNQGVPAILHYAADGTYINTLSAVPVGAPGTLVFGPNGHLYIGDLAFQKIFEVDTSDGSVVSTKTLGYTPGGIAFTADTGEMVVGDFDTQSLVQYHSVGPATIYSTPGVFPASILPMSNGDLLLGDLDATFVQPDSHNRVVLFSGGTVSPFINLTAPLGDSGHGPQAVSMAYDRDGNLLVGVSADHSFNGAVEKFNILTKQWMGTLVTDIGTPTGLVVTGKDLLVSMFESPPSANYAVARYQIQPSAADGSVAVGDHGLGKAQGLAQAPDGSFYVSSNQGVPAIMHYAADGTYISTLPVPAGAPGTLVFGPNGHLYIGDLFLQTITEYDPGTSTITHTMNLDYTPGGINFTADTHEMVVGDFDIQGLVEYHAGGSSTTYSLPGVFAASILPMANGDLLIGDLDFTFVQPDSHNRVVLFSTHTSPSGTVSPFINLTAPLGDAGHGPQAASLAYDRDGNLLVGVSADHSLNGAVEKFNILTKAWMSTLVTDIGTPTGLAVTGGDLLVSMFESSPDEDFAVARYHIQPAPLAGSVPEGNNGLGLAQGLAVAPDGSYYVSSNQGLPAIMHYSAAGNYLETLPVPAGAPGTLVFGPNGHLYIGDLFFHTITEYDPSTALIVNTQSLGFTPGGIAFTADTHEMVVGDFDIQGLVQYHAVGAPTTYFLPGVFAASILPLSNGDLLIGDLDVTFVQPDSHNRVVLFSGGTVSPFIDLTAPVGDTGSGPQATSLAYDTDGNLLVGVSADHNNNGAVEKFNILTKAWMGTLVTDIGTPTGLGLVPSISTNSPPVLDLNSATAGLGFNAKWVGSAVAITSAANATLSDADGGNLDSLTITLDAFHTGDVISANTSGTSILQSYSLGTLELSGSDSIAHYQQVLRTITYNNTAGGPGVNRLFAEIVASDGTVTSNLAVAEIDVPPVIRLNAVNGANFSTTWYNNGNSPSDLANGAVALGNMAQATVTDGAGLANITSMTVALTTFVAGDVLTVPIVAGVAITATYIGGTLTLSGNDTLAHYQQELRLISYNNTNNGPGVTQKKATFVASDGTVTGNAITSTINISLPTGTQVLANRLFYQNSRYDGHAPTGTMGGDSAVNSFDDAAIASDKTGLVVFANGASVPGTATFANVSSATKGITGVIIDVVGGIGTHTLINKSSGDITFKIAPTTVVSGTYNQLSTWTGVVPTVTSISVRVGAGIGGSDRIEITWAATLAVKNNWLEINLKSTANTGLASDYAFIYGSDVGNSGLNDPAGQSKTEAFDGTAPTTNNLGLTTQVFQILDYDKDGQVNATDSVTASSNNGQLLVYLRNPTGPYAPDGGAPSASPAAVAAALPTSSSTTNSLTSGLGTLTAPTKLPTSLAGRLENLLHSPPVEKLLHGVHSNAPMHHAVDQTLSRLHLKDDALDGLLRDLGLE